MKMFLKIDFASLLKHHCLVFVFAGLWGIMRFAYAEIGDDAMITFTYARNLVEGNGFVFNPGEVVYGTTTPLWGLFAALGLKIGVAPWTWTLCWDVIFGGVVLWRMREILGAVDAAVFFPLAAALVVYGSAYTLRHAGMETGCYNALIWSSLAALVCRRAPWRAIFWAGWAMALRPDGIAILAVACVYAVVRLWGERDWRPWATSAAPLAIPGVFALALLLYFGTLIPQSVVAKSYVTHRASHFHQFWYLLVRGIIWNMGVLNVSALFAVFGFGLWIRDRTLRPVALFVGAYIGFFVVGRAPAFPWYYTPLVLVGCLYFVIGGLAVARYLVERCGARMPNPRVAFPVLYACLVLAALLPQLPVMTTFNRGAFLVMGPELHHHRYREIAEAINRESKGAARMAGLEIGYFGYFLEGHVFDTCGLVTPASIEAMKTGTHPLLVADSEWYVVPTWSSDLSRDEAEIADAAGYTLHSKWDWPGGWTYVFRRPVKAVAPPPAPAG
ncbi:MAG: hypothetical protein PWP23_1724 [Candidatus Sumerlaeota bacterium]|nr:hypothetical protein [Candidatus Sumerlaeota bacterium]